MSNMVSYAIGVMLLFGEVPQIGPFTEFIMMLTVIAVAAPGAPGGVVLASAAILESALGFTPERYALLVAMYMALDGMGTACNLTGDGAVALVVDRFRKKTVG
jgi:Na+/H+-dicarboxylate symporter